MASLRRRIELPYLVSLHDQLMSSCDKLYIVIMIELVDYVATEQETSSSW